MKRLITIFALLLSLGLAARAQLSEVNVYPFELESGARPLGMGSAFVGLADDANSLLYNPGGMAWARGVSFSLKDFQNLTALQAYPTGLGSSLGLAIVNSNLTDIPIPGGTATSNSSVMVLSYGTKLNFIPALYKKDIFKTIGLGMNLKILMGETLNRTGQPDRSATGLDMDLGILWKRTEWWWFGASLQNFLPTKLHWDFGADEGFPASLKLGTAAHLIGDIGSPIFQEGRDLLVAGEIDVHHFSPTLLRLGAELGFNKTYFIRGGIMQQNQSGTTVTPINLGLGYRAGEWGADLVYGQEPATGNRQVSFSFIYLPKEWVVVQKLDFDRPAVMLEKAIEKISLEDNITTYDDRLQIVGRVKPGVEIYVNGLHAAVSADNNFSVVIPLEIGKNLIVVEARFEGEKKAWKYKVLRKAKITIAEEKTLSKQLSQKNLSPDAKQALEQKQEQLNKNKDKVEELVTLGVIEVTPEAEFKLDASVTRGEMAAWLTKAANLRIPKVDKDVTSDVHKDNPLAPFVKVVIDLNMIRPFPDGTFRPQAPLTKEEGARLMALMGIKQ